MIEENGVNPPIDPAILNQLVAAYVERILADRERANPSPPSQDAQLEEIKILKDEMKLLR